MTSTPRPTSLSVPDPAHGARIWGERPRPVQHSPGELVQTRISPLRQLPLVERVQPAGADQGSLATAVERRPPFIRSEEVCSPILPVVPEPVPAVIVAAGRGVRFGGPIPKPVATLAGKAVVAMSVEAMAAGGCTHAVVVIPRNGEHHFQPALAASPIPVTLVEGDETRQSSVRRGIKAILQQPELRGARVVLVHDAVRPLVPATVVERVIRTVSEGAVAVAPAIPVADSIRAEDEHGRLTIVDRNRLRAIQTPQGFDLQVLNASHDYCALQGIECTDDLSVCEAAGHSVSVVKGAMTALKITSATDLDLAHAFLKLRKGFGRHSFRRVLRHRPFAWVVKPAEAAPVIRSEQ